MWKAQVAALRERYRVINIDAPGHGRSSAVRQPFDMAGDLMICCTFPGETPDLSGCIPIDCILI